MATSDRRRSARVVFEKGIDVSIMGIDGTWRRPCYMEDHYTESQRAVLRLPNRSKTNDRWFDRGPKSQRVLSPAIVHRPSLSPLRVGLGQRR
jgi:hypothetical protein